MSELISIIVPIYKVEKYINQCIESIINQTYKNIEIILVDDGSPDKCPIMCDNYKKKDKRIKVIHKKNGGLSDARNAGIEIATGNYICFVDSDDFIKPNYIELLYKAIIKNNTKISQCGFIYYDGSEKERINYKENKVLCKRDYFYDNYTSHKTDNTVVWNKMYSRDIFRNLKFNKGKIHEDEFFTYKAIEKAEKISIIKECLYSYRMNEDSITRKLYNTKRLDVLDAFKEKNDYFKNNYDEDIYNNFGTTYLDILLYHFGQVSKYIKDKSIKKNIRNEIIKIYKTFNIINIKVKIKTIIFVYLPLLYELIIRIG